MEERDDARAEERAFDVGGRWRDELGDGRVEVLIQRRQFARAGLSVTLAVAAVPVINGRRCNRERPRLLSLLQSFWPFVHPVGDLTAVVIR
jgi:hypothetical protein